MKITTCTRNFFSILLFVFLPLYLTANPMLVVQYNPYKLSITEHVGLQHEPQVIEVDIPSGSAEIIKMKDQNSGLWYFVQRSDSNPQKGFLLLDLKPHQKIILSSPEPSSSEELTFSPVRIKQKNKSLIIGNEKYALYLPYSGGDEIEIQKGQQFPEGPVHKIRVKDGAWRGRTFFDLRSYPDFWESELIEKGPIHTKWHYRLKSADNGLYEMYIVVDAVQEFAQIEENSQFTLGDQLVWDFSGDDLPNEMAFIESGPSLRFRQLDYHIDEQLGRLACWNQFSQLHDFFNGFGFQVQASNDFIGFVMLEGGEWQGNRHNHLEAWSRRWIEQRETSRKLPREWKSDGFPGPEVHPPLRGHSRSSEHLNIEGWIGSAKRKYALVLCEKGELYPPEQEISDYDINREPLSLLKRIYIQSGILSLEAMKNMTFEWENENFNRYDDARTGLAIDSRMTDNKEEVWGRVRNLVGNFWTQMGPAGANPVSSRSVAWHMYAFEKLIRENQITEEEAKKYRANVSLLMYLFHSDNYYPGLASMLPYQDIDSWEPTMKGMANQNFYTDVLNLYGTGGLLFYKHPEAELFINKANDMWDRQLQYHVYPESGVWEESHTYYHHVLHTILPYLIRSKNEGKSNFFENSDFQNMVQASTKQITPRDKMYFNQERYLAPLGDHMVNNGTYRSLYRIMAQEFFAHDEALAHKLAWMYREMGGKEELSMTSERVDWEDEWVQGLGYFFRSTDQHGEDNLLVLRAGSAWGHHHLDDGSIQFYACGQPLITDAGFGFNLQDMNKVSSEAHSRWTFKDYEPLDYLWRFTRGWIEDYQKDSRFSYARAYCPEYMAKLFLPRTASPREILLPEPAVFYRTVIRLAENMYLIIDQNKSRVDQETNFHIPFQENATINSSLVDVVYSKDCRLQMTVLAAEEMEVHTSTILPERWNDDDGIIDKFKTIKVGYDSGKSDFQAYLIKAGKSNDNLMVDQKDIGDYHVKDKTSSIRITFKHSMVSIVDMKTKEKTEIEI